MTMLKDEQAFPRGKKKPVTILTRNLLQQSYLKELCLHVYF